MSESSCSSMLSALDAVSVWILAWCRCVVIAHCSFNFFFDALFICLFIFGCSRSPLLHRLFSSCGEWGLLPSWGAWAFHGGGLSCCRARALGTGLQQLQPAGSVAGAPRHWSTGSVIVARGFSCSMVCGILQDQGSNPCLLHWQADSWSLSHQGSSNIFLTLWTASYLLCIPPTVLW